MDTGRGLQVCIVGVHHCIEEGKRLWKRQYSGEGEEAYVRATWEEEAAWFRGSVNLCYHCFYRLYFYDDFNRNTEQVYQNKKKKKHRSFNGPFILRLISCLCRNFPSGLN